MIKKTIYLTSLVTFLLFVAVVSGGEETLLPEKIELPKEAVFKNVLENGLIVLIKESYPQDLVAIDIKIKAGSSLEGEYSGCGISHLVEHMLFKGTKSRKVGDIEREVKSYGGFINGTASHDLTDYHVTVSAKYFAETLAILKDMLRNATFDEEEFQKEKEVVIKEIKLNKDEPQSELMKLLYETAYINHPYKYPVIGYEEKLKSLARDDLVKYYERMYVPNRIVISIVGGVNKTEVLSKIEDEFKDFRPPNYQMDAQNFEPPEIGERRLEKEAQVALAYLGLAFHSTRLLDKDLFAMDVLSMILGRGDNSRLNKVLFKEKRIVHSISAWNYTPRDPGLFGITAVLDSENLDNARNAILAEIEKLREGTIDNEEIEIAKRMVLGDFIFSRETLEEQADDISGNEILTGSYDFSRQYVNGIQSVSREDLKRVANKYLLADTPTFVSLFPVGSQKIEDKEESAIRAKDIIKKETLTNGLKILTRVDRKIPTISISAVFLGGLSAESRVKNGISNLTSRMLLKGTTTKKESDITGSIESRGGNISTFSGYDSFGINVVVLKPDLETAMKIIKDVLTDSVFPENELDRQRILTLAMIKNEKDDIFNEGSYLLKKNLFEGHPYGLRVLGEYESISSLKREDIIDFYKSYCIPNNMVISISGDIDPEKATQTARDLFSDMKPGKVPPFFAKYIKQRRRESQVVEMEKVESLVLLGFKTTNIKDPDKYALDVVGSILSGYSGRLFASVRDKLSLAYTLGCVQKISLEAGYLVFYVATIKDKIDETKKILVDEIGNINTQPVGDDELAMAKRELHSGYKIRMQANGFYAFQSAIDELYGLGYDNLYKYEDEIEHVTGEDVKRVANKYLDLTNCVEVIVISK